MALFPRGEDPKRATWQTEFDRILEQYRGSLGARPSEYPWEPEPYGPGWLPVPMPSRRGIKSGPNFPEDQTTIVDESPIITKGFGHPRTVQLIHGTGGDFGKYSDKNIYQEMATINYRLGDAFRLAKKIKHQPHLISDQNRQLVRGFFDGSNNAFSGGDFEDIENAFRGHIDMAPLDAAKRRLEESGLLKKLIPALSTGAPRRKRRNSEYDGEWSYDRRFEIEPFSHCSRIRPPVQTVEIECDFSISGFASAQSINTYGATVWAISDLIEKSGVQTSISISMKASHSWTLGSMDGGVRVDLEVKKPGEYITPSVLAAAFTANFYRRVGFGLLAMGGEIMNAKIGEGIGRPVGGTTPRIQFNKGRLYIGPDISACDPGALAKEVLRALGTK